MTEMGPQWRLAVSPGTIATVGTAGPGCTLATTGPGSTLGTACRNRRHRVTPRGTAHRHPS